MFDTTALATGGALPSTCFEVLPYSKHTSTRSYSKDTNSLVQVCGRVGLAPD